mgnify:CR=1 FL=1
MKRFVALAMVGVFAVFAAQAGAQGGLIGSFELVQSNADLSNGAADVWHFNLKNNEDKGVQSIQNVLFSGEGFVQSLGDIQDSPELPGFGTSVFADTFFSGRGSMPTAPGGVKATETELSTDAIGALGEAWVLPGESTPIAVFSVPVGGAPPTFVGGQGVLFPGLAVVDIVPVPEPATMSLAALALLALVGLRRRSN